MFGEAVAGAVYNIHPDRQRKSKELYPRLIRTSMVYRLPIDGLPHLFKCVCGAEYELDVLPTGRAGSEFILTTPARVAVR